MDSFIILFVNHRWILKTLLWLFLFRLFLEESKLGYDVSAPDLQKPLHQSLIELNFIFCRLYRQRGSLNYQKGLLNHYISILRTLEDDFFDSLQWDQKIIISFSLFDNARRLKCVNCLRDLFFFRSSNDSILNELAQLISGSVFLPNHIWEIILMNLVRLLLSRKDLCSVTVSKPNISICRHFVWTTL